MANKRITDVDFIDSLSSNESFFVNQNSALRQINRNNVVFDVINGGTGATTAEDALENLGAASQTDLNAVQTDLNAVSVVANAAMPKANFVFDAETGTLNITL